MSKPVETFDGFPPQASGLQGPIDNHFTPGPRTGGDGEEAECLFAVIATALVAGLFVLGQLLGAF